MLEIKRTLVRKRPSPQCPADEFYDTLATPLQAMNIFHSTPNSNSKKRRKKSQRKGFYHLYALCIVLALLFLSSLCLFVFDVPSSMLSTNLGTRLLSPQFRGSLDHRAASIREFLPSTATSTELFQQYTLQAPLCTAPLTVDDVDFTVVTQLSLNRMWMLKHHCARWPRAISLAVHVGNDTSVTVDRIAEQVLRMGCRLERIHIQTLYGYSDEEYPVNILRNMALAAVTTSHVVYVDVDFWESIDLYDTLLSHKALLAAHAKLALVVPAFQLSRQCRGRLDCRDDNIPKMPHVKEELLDLMIENQADAFDPFNRVGHGSTRYKDWLIQEKEQLLSIECIKSNRYEPYLVFRKCYDLPPFQEAFTGYGKNKMTWVMQLRRTGYQLMQLGGAFLVHYPHLESSARIYWNGGKDGAPLPKPKNPSVDLSTYKRGQVDVTFVAFREWLFRSVPDQAIVPMCEDASDDDARLWIAPKEQMRR